jgi:flagellar hook-basal body complex protein FliE
MKPVNFSELPTITFEKPAVSESSPGGDFAKMLGDAAKNVSAAEQKNDRFVSTEVGQLHENAIALEKANVSLRMIVGVRNKVVDAYNQIMRMS